jgi:WD40 repeat protein
VDNWPLYRQRNVNARRVIACILSAAAIAWLATIIVFGAWSVLHRLPVLYSDRCHAGAVRGILFSADDQKLFSGGMDGALVVRAARTGRLEHKLSHGAGLVALCEGTSGLVAAAYFDGMVHLWNASSGTLKESHAVWGSGRGTVAWGSSDTTILTGDIEGAVRAWDRVMSWKPTLLDRHRFGVLVISLVPRSNRIAVRFDDGTLKVIDPEGQVATVVLEGSPICSNVYSLAASRDGRTVAINDLDGNVGLFDTTDWRRTLTLPTRRRSPITRLAFVGSGDEELVFLRQDGGIEIWDTNTRRLTLQAFEAGAETLAVSTDGHALAVGDYKGRVTVFELRSRR